MIERARNEGCLSDLRLDAIVIGEATREEREEANEHLAGCTVCSARLASFERDARSFSVPFPARKVVPFKRAWVGISALALAAALFLFLRTQQEQDATRLKGTPAGMGFFIEHDGQVRRGLPGEQVEPGDKLQFVVATRTAAYVAVISVDGAGTANVYYTSNAPVAPTTGNVETPLPSSVLLDDVLGKESLWGLVCDAPQAEAALKKLLAEHNERFKAPAGCSETRWTIAKKPRR